MLQKEFSELFNFFCNIIFQKIFMCLYYGYLHINEIKTTTSSKIFVYDKIMLTHTIHKSIDTENNKAND